MFFSADGFVSSEVVQDLIDKVNQLNDTVQQQSKMISQPKGSDFSLHYTKLAMLPELANQEIDL